MKATHMRVLACLMGFRRNGKLYAVCPHGTVYVPLYRQAGIRLYPNSERRIAYLRSPFSFSFFSLFPFFPQFFFSPFFSFFPAWMIIKGIGAEKYGTPPERGVLDDSHSSTHLLHIIVCDEPWATLHTQTQKRTAACCKILPPPPSERVLPILLRYAFPPQ